MAITFRLSTKFIIKLNVNSLSLTYTHYNLEQSKIDKLDKSGVYKLTCHDCDAFKIGQTGRSFKTHVTPNM